MPTYESDGFQPPAPVIHAHLRGPAESTIPDVPLLIDTGADLSVVPLRAATAVGAAMQPSAVPIQWYMGEETVLDWAELTVEFLGYRFRGSFLVADSSYGIVGRNMLNLVLLTLDGPRLTWSVAT